MSTPDSNPMSPAVAGGAVNFSDYFPIAEGRYGHHFWRNWCQAFPQARVRSVEADRWFHQDDLPLCQRVVVGIPGIPAKTAVEWTMTMTNPTVDQVRDALSGAKK